MQQTLPPWSRPVSAHAHYICLSLSAPAARVFVLEAGYARRAGEDRRSLLDSEQRAAYPPPTRSIPSANALSQQPALARCSPRMPLPQQSTGASHAAPPAGTTPRTRMHDQNSGICCRCRARRRSRLGHRCAAAPQKAPHTRPLAWHRHHAPPAPLG